MIGVSLHFGELAEGKWTQALPSLREQGVESVELRTVRPRNTPEQVLTAAQTVWDAGLQITVHGTVGSEQTAVADVFAPLESLWSVMRQKSLTVTVHPIVGDNAAVMKALSSHIEAHSLPVRIALENNRLLPDKTEGDSAALVLAAVKAADSPHVGICWDMGHYSYYRMQNHPEDPHALPDKEFLKRVIHTHIHAMDGLKTHFPLDTHVMPPDGWFAALACGYYGVYNLELEFTRFDRPPMEALHASVQTMAAHLPFCARLYDEVRLHFDEWMHSAASVLQRDEGVRFGLLHSTSYLFNTHGFAWGMDVAIRQAPRALAETPARLAQILGNLQLMVITHGHADHFERGVVQALASTPMEWVIPDFLVARAREWGIDEHKLHVAREGQPLQVGPLTIRPFAGRHFRPDGNGVPEYGYYVTAPQAPSLVFPADVRDYTLTALPDLPPADYCFAHVWLSDEPMQEDKVAAYVEPFVRFMLHFSAPTVLLTHLYEDGRTQEAMWQEHHAQRLKTAFCRLSPHTEVLIPPQGTVIKL